MEKDRGFKVLAVVALLIAVVGVSVGFASWTRTLTITGNSNNIVKDYTNQFANVTLGSAAVSTTDGETGVTGENMTAAGTASGADWSGMTAVFDNTRRKAVFTATVSNTTAYNAYLTSLTTSGKITCAEAGTKATANAQTGDTTTVNKDLLKEICDSAKMTVAFTGNGQTVSRLITSADEGQDITAADNLYVPRSGTKGMTTGDAGTATVKVTVELGAATDVRMPDADVKITLPTISFGYSSLLPSQTKAS